jgi:AcrR family transcriptional regulator
MSETSEHWIEKGYEHFALYGPQNISIEKIAEETGLARTSFYYYFGDIESFIDELLSKHTIEAEKLKSEIVNSCKVYIPDFILLMVKYKIQILFNKRLADNQKNPKFLLTYNYINNIVDNAALDLWAESFGIKGERNFLKAVYSLLRDSYYTRISIDNLNYDSIIKDISEIRETIGGIISSHRFFE